MKNDHRITELHEVLDPLAKITIMEESDEVSLIVEKPVDIEAVDVALLSALHAEPLDRFERQDSWHIRLMKREQKRPSGLRYKAVRVMDSYYEYRPQLSDLQ